MTEDDIASLIENLCADYKESDFLCDHEEFLKNHLDFLFSRKEGSACSHDKTRTIISLLKKHFKDGKDIEINFEQKITFHLPKKILNGHGQIMEAYRALSDLYYGNPVRYLTLVKEFFIMEKK